VKYLVSQISFFLTEREARQNIGALLRYLAFVLLVIATYTVLFHVIMLHAEGQEHSWLAGLYFVLVTMSTLGFGDITFQTDIGRAFSILVLLSGIVLLLVMLPFIFISYFLAPWLAARVRLRAPREAPAGLRGHVIITHDDSIAPDLIAKLGDLGIPYLLLEPEAERAARLHVDGISVLTGEVDARETYERAGAERARLVLANGEDTMNTNIVLTVREFAPSVPIATIASSEDSIDILELSGSTHVLPLRRRLGEHLANRANTGTSRAHIIGGYAGLHIAEFPVQNTPLAGRRIRDTQLRKATGLNILGVWERGRLLPALPDTVLTDKSVPVVMGTREQIGSVEELLAIYHANDNPVVVIGGGKVGRAATRALRRAGAAVHLIEKDEGLRPRLVDVADRLIIGDAADRAVLRGAGILDAPSVLITTHDDAVNIFLAVYCRKLNPELRVICRVTHDRNIEAVLRAGTDFVLSYAWLGAETVLGLLEGHELVALGEGLSFYQLPLPVSLAGRTLAESGIGARTGLNVVAVRLGDELRANPHPGTLLEHGMGLLLLGTAQQLKAYHEVYG
jgi:voltage-gated potassium channel